MSDLGKFDALLHETYIKVFLVIVSYKGFDMCRSILSLSKIAHQMWHDHPFSQRNMTTERAVEWSLAVTGKWEGGWTTFVKRG